MLHFIFNSGSTHSLIAYYYNSLVMICWLLWFLLIHLSNKHTKSKVQFFFLFFFLFLCIKHLHSLFTPLGKFQMKKKRIYSSNGPCYPWFHFQCSCDKPLNYLWIVNHWKNYLYHPLMCNYNSNMAFPLIKSSKHCADWLKPDESSQRLQISKGRPISL